MFKALGTGLHNCGEETVISKTQSITQAQTLPDSMVHTPSHTHKRLHARTQTHTHTSSFIPFPLSLQLSLGLSGMRQLKCASIPSRTGKSLPARSAGVQRLSHQATHRERDNSRE